MPRCLDVDREILQTNYHALMVAILAACDPETAFAKLNGNIRPYFGDQDQAEVYRLRRNGYSWAEIADIFSLSVPEIFKNLRTCRTKATTL